MKKYELFDRNTQSFIYSLQPKAIQRMLDFDFLIARNLPSISAIIQPGSSGFHKVFFGTNEILIPIYSDIEEASKNHPKTDVLINFASMRSAYESSLEALNTDQIRVIAIIGEGVPERRSRELAMIAKKKNKLIIGPATVGGIKAGAFKIGDTAGTIENIIDSKLHRPGSVGFVSKSGGMSNEMYNVLAQTTNGVYEGISIGGDRYPGSQLIDHILRFEANPDIKMIISLGEIGGTEEYAIVDALKNGKIKKPLIIWVTGTCASVFPSEVQFGHAGAASGNKETSAEAKNKALKEAGAYVPNSFDDFPDLIKKVFVKLEQKKKIPKIIEPKLNIVPEDY